MKSALNWRFKANTLALSVAAAMMVVTGVQAQEQLEEIQITGTRIRTTDGMVTPTPVTAVTTTEMQSFDPASSVSEQLDNLPQFLNTQTAQRGGATLFGDAAGSYLNLRNMGKQRTLVLFDGSRVVPADRASSVNVDNFPTALIRTVDVVTGGASAAYGADALAGVVNFVLDRDFEGFKSQISTGVTEEGDGQNWNFSVAGGKQIGDKLHVIGSIEHRDIKQIYRDPADFESFDSWGFVRNPKWVSATATPNEPQRLTVKNVHSAIQNAAGLITSPAPGFKFNRYTFTDDGKAMRPFVTGDYRDAGNGFQAGGPEAASAKAAFDGSAPQGAEVIQHSGFGGFKYDLSDTTELFGQIMLGRTESNTYGRRGNPEMGNAYRAQISIENAFLPEELRQAMVDANITEVTINKIGQVRTANNNNFYDNRNDSNISQMWSASAGFDTALSNGWDLRGSYQYGESYLTTEAEGIIRVDHWYLAQDAVRDPRTGAIVCKVQQVNPTMAQLQAAAKGQTVLTTRINEFPTALMPIDNILVTPETSIRDCVPMNVFGLGNVSEEADAYVTSDDKKGIRDLDQHFAELLLTGELYEGWGAGPVGFAAGLTYREEWFNQYTRPISMERTTLNAPELGIRFIPTQISGGNRSIHQFSATSWATGEFDVWEWYSEVNVPVWESASGSQRIDTTAAFRQSEYSLAGKVDSWKLGADIKVFDDLRLRVTKSRDVREPTFAEAFESGGGGGDINDPRFPGTRYTVTLLTLGNATLRPEIADTLTAGVVYTPTFASWIDGLSVSADWYQIDVADRISPLGAQRLVTECEAGNQVLCSQVVRNAAGRVERVDDKQINVANSMTKGVDIEVRYDLEPDFLSSLEENMTFRLFAGHLIENSLTTTTYIDNVGNITNPEWTATASLGYNFGDFGVNILERYYDSTLYAQGLAPWTSGLEVDDATISSQSVTNLVLSYRGETSSGGNWVASFNVNNLFDRAPPIVATENQRGGQQGVNNVFDVFGRRYQVSLNYNF